MNNGSPVAHYTGEGSRAVLYVKTWTAGSGVAGRTIGVPRSVRAAKADLFKFCEGRDIRGARLVSCQGLVNIYRYARC